MSATGNPASAVRAGVVAAVVAIVVGIVVGIVGMHALTLHVAAVSGPSSMPTMAGMAGPVETDAARHTDGDELHGTGTSTTNQPGPGMGDMVMLCAVMLATAGLALLLLLLLRRVPLPSWTLARPWRTTVARLVAPGRAGAGPPSVWAFSVIRC